MDYQPTESSREKVGPRPTVDGNAPTLRSKLGKRIHIGGPFKTEYPVSAAMASWRGDEKQPSTARVKGSRDYTPPGSQISTGPSRGVSASTIVTTGYLQ